MTKELKRKRANVLKDKKKDKGTNQKPIMYKLTCRKRGWTDM